MSRRAANQTAVYFAAIGTIICGMSNSMEMLIAARFVRYIISLSYARRIDDVADCWNGRRRSVYHVIVRIP